MLSGAIKDYINAATPPSPLLFLTLTGDHGANPDSAGGVLEYVQSADFDNEIDMEQQGSGMREERGENQPALVPLNPPTIVSLPVPGHARSGSWDLEPGDGSARDFHRDHRALSHLRQNDQEKDQQQERALSCSGVACLSDVLPQVQVATAFDLEVLPSFEMMI